MAVLGGDYTGCTILVYDTSGNHLGSTTVTQYDKAALRIEIREFPPALRTGDRCNLLILTSPTPCEYSGRVSVDGKRHTLALFMGKEHENRAFERYKVSCSAVVENYISGNKAYPLLAPLEIKVINISKSGLRFRAASYTVCDGDRFQVRIKINDNNKLLIIEAVNHLDTAQGTTEYGCRFLVSK